MMLRNLVVAAIAALIPIAAGAIELTINGKTFTVNSVNVSTTASGVTITTNPAIDLGGGTTPPPTNPPPTNPPPTAPPPPATGSCGALPAGVVVAGNIDWTQPGGQIRHALSSETKSFRFTTTNNPAFEGQIAIGYTSQNPTIKTVWVSECPGTPVSSAEARCVTDGYETAIVRWAQHSNSRIACQLQTNRTYFINVKNAAKGNPDTSTCPSGNCSFYMIIYNNQRS